MFGFDKFLEMFEERFGRHPTTALLLLIAVAIVSVCLGLIYNQLFVPIYDFITKNFPSIPWPQITATTLFYILGLAALVAILLPIFSYFGARRRVPQAVIDQLATLRSDAIRNILNAQVTSSSEFQMWQRTHTDWRNQIINILERHFTVAEKLSFQRLGLIPVNNFPQAFNNQHNFELMLFSKQLTVLEDIIARHTK